jgi:hypothetical protein
MTLASALEGQSLKGAQLKQGSLLLLGVAASLMLAFRRHNGILLGVLLVLGTVVVPAGYILARRTLDKTRQRETEDRLMMHTRTFLQNQEPARGRVESDIEVLARAIDGRKLPPQDFRKLEVTPAPVPIGDPVVFDALPRRYATGSLCDRRFVDLAAKMPEPASVPLDQLLQAPGARARNPAIEFSNAVIEEMSMRTAEGYQALRHGGAEVGGVLFGARRAGVLHILAVRPVECEHENGPRFVLSRRDETGLAELLLASCSDPALAGLEPAGYYRSHAGEEICFSEADVQLFDRFFPLPGQVALVVRPANLGPAQGGFFFREEDGTTREFKLTSAA